MLTPLETITQSQEHAAPCAYLQASHKIEKPGDPLFMRGPTKTWLSEIHWHKVYELGVQTWHDDSTSNALLQRSELLGPERYT